MKLGLAIRQVRAAEHELADALDAIGEGHGTDHEVYHLTRMLAAFSRAHVAALAPVADRYPLVGDPEGSDERGLLGKLGEQMTELVFPAEGSPEAGGASGIMGTVREKTSELVGRQPLSGLLLLRDLRALYLHASAACIDWSILERGAEAARDAELLQTAKACHAETEKTLKWAETMAKSLSPQVLMT
jgi:hypothetical protein